MPSETNNSEAQINATILSAINDLYLKTISYEDYKYYYDFMVDLINQNKNADYVAIVAALLSANIKFSSLEDEENCENVKENLRKFFDYLNEKQNNPSDNESNLKISEIFENIMNSANNKRHKVTKVEYYEEKAHNLIIKALISAAATALFITFAIINQKKSLSPTDLNAIASYFDIGVGTLWSCGLIVFGVKSAIYEIKKDELTTTFADEELDCSEKQQTLSRKKD